MRITIDDQISTLQHRGGISRYFAELIDQFRTANEHAVQPVTARFAKSEHYLDRGIGRALPGRLGHRRVLRLANRMASRTRACDAVHHTYYDPSYMVRYVGAMHRITTVHDMIPELLPELFPGGNPHLAKEKYVRAADLVLCVSETTKRDLAKLYGPLGAPVVVTPLGVHQRFSPDSPRLRQLPSRYVLYVGGRRGYKDFHVLAQAFAATAARRDATALVAVGGGAFNDRELKGLVALGIERVTHQVNLDDAELASAYAHACCFVFPSRYEGFGLPTLEAMASGCPTILARSSSHPEVGGDAAVYFWPGDVDALVKALDEVMPDQERRKTMRAAGLAQAASFTWERTAAATAQAYAMLDGRN